MVDKEMLLAISGLLDEKLEGLKNDVADLKTDVADLKSMRTDVESLKGEMQYIRVVLLENNVIPRLNTIESCYLDTFQRYKERTEQFDQMDEDIEVLKSVVSDHSRKLEKIPG